MATESASLEPPEPPEPPEQVDWQRYIDGFHNRRAGRTEEVLGRLSAAGMTPYDWVTRPVSGRGRRVLDLGCGSGPVARRLRDERLHPLVVGVDRSSAELDRARRLQAVPVVCADATALPFTDGAFDAVVASMVLMVASPLDGVLAECNRVLRTGGMLSATVASPLPVRPGDLWLLGRLTAKLGTAPQFPGGGELAGLRGAMDRAGFDVLEDGRERFVFEVRTPADAGLFLRTLYFRQIRPGRLESAIAWLSAQAEGRQDGVRVPTPIRRVLAMRR